MPRWFVGSGFLRPTNELGISYMKTLDNSKKERLQKILSKRFRRPLTDIELEQAYNSLMQFIVALISLNEYSGDKTKKVARNTEDNV